MHSGRVPDFVEKMSLLHRFEGPPPHSIILHPSPSLLHSLHCAALHRNLECLSQLCTKGTPVEIVETLIHTAGMQIMTADGFCFDGTRFRACNDGDPTLR